MGDEVRPRHRSIRADGYGWAECSDSSTSSPDAEEMTSGFVAAGSFEPVFAVELDRDAAASYAENFGDDHVFAGPIEDGVRIPGR